MKRIFTARPLALAVGAVLRQTVLAGLVLLTLVPVTSSAQPFTFANVASTNTSVPGQAPTVRFTSFGANPSVSGGTVAFNALFGSTGGNGIYIGAAGVAPSLVADTTTAEPGGANGNFTGFAAIPTISGTTVAFRGNFTGNGGQGIYTSTVGGTPVRAAVTNTAAPGQGGATFVSFNNASVSGTNVGFTGGFSTIGNGIYASVAGSAPTLVADRSTPVPGGLNGSFTGLSDPALSGSNVAFFGTFGGGGGVYVRTLGGSFVTVADTNTSVPGQAAGVKFNTGFSTPSISGNNVAFAGRFTGGQGIYAETLGGPLSIVASTSTAVPGHIGNFTGFTLPSTSGANTAFVGFYNAGNSRGIFLSLGGVLVDVIDTGSPLFGSTVTSLDLGAFGLDSGTLTFAYTLANGVSGIAVTGVPEPGTWALLLTGGTAALLGVRRHRSLASRAA